MQKSKNYPRTYFTGECIKEASQVLSKYPSREQKKRHGLGLRTQLPNESWGYDNEDEFFADYRSGVKYA
jgi:hypothetical protein